VDADRADDQAGQERSRRHACGVDRDGDREDASVQVRLDRALADPEHRDDERR
jgi:hypothetical protein